MKKKRTLRASSLLMALTLATTSFVGGTFAKYVTISDKEASARVASWGFYEGYGGTSIELTPLFSKEYQKDDSNYTLGSNTVQINENAVQSNEYLIAPGTSGNAGFRFSYGGISSSGPEVAYRFTVDTTGSECKFYNLEGNLIDSNFIQWAVGESPDFYAQPGNTLNYGTFEEMLTTIEGMSGNESGTKDYEPLTLPEAFGTGNTKYIYWRWNFDSTDQQNEVDTLQGLIAGDPDHRGTVKIRISIKAEQID